LFVAAAVFAAFSFVARAASPAAADLEPFTSLLQLAPSPATVRADLGEPDAKLGPLVWIYWNFGPKRDNPETDTLVIAFKNDRVLTVKITDGRVMRQLLAQAAARNAKTTTVAAAPAKR
jgi:hypothetical protein